MIFILNKRKDFCATLIFTKNRSDVDAGYVYCASAKTFLGIQGGYKACQLINKKKIVFLLPCDTPKRANIDHLKSYLGSKWLRYGINQPAFTSVPVEVFLERQSR